MIRELICLIQYVLQRALWWLVQRFDTADKYRRLIESTGIVVFVGPNGSGKSLAAVASVVPVLDGETWECRALEHTHNAELLAHVERCDACDHRSITKPRRCRRGTWLARLGLDVTESHLLRCSGCEWFPGQAGGRCSTAEGLVRRCGVGHRLVYSTVPLLDDDGHDHPLYRPCTDYRQLIGIEHADVLFDEVAGVSDAADSSSVPPQLTRWLQQLRKRDVRLRVTTPAYSRCSKPIRQIAQVVVDARSYLPEVATPGRRWRPRRAMIYRAYDAFEFDDFTMAAASNAQQKKGRLRAQARLGFWRPGCEAERRYDTLAQVLALGDVDTAGMCMVCGGARSRVRCACPSHVDQEDGELVVIEETSKSGSRIRRAELRVAGDGVEPVAVARHRGG